MKMINPLIIARILSTILLIESLCFLVCIPVSLSYSEPSRPFLLSSAITGSLCFILRMLSLRTGITKISIRDSYITVALAWIILSLAGTLPYILSGTISSLNDAFFESASGFTTTGASVITDVEILPFSILFWRSFTHWIGGIGIIVLVIIILPALKLTAHQLFSLESSLKEKIQPKTKTVGAILLMAYTGLTIIQILLLWAGDMNLFESVCLTFGTVATGGFSVRNTGLISYSPYSQYVIAIFMFLSGVSFVVYYYLIKRQFHKIRQNNELVFYTAVVLISGTVISLMLLSAGDKETEPAFREGFFQVISIITTTGYTTVDYLTWPSAGLLIIFVLMFAGACTGSTTGSIKMARHLIVLKNIRLLFVRLIHPNAVIQLKMNGRPVSDRVNMSILTFVLLYVVIFLSATLIVVLTGVDTVTSAGAVASTLGNVGPGLGAVGPMFNYNHLPEADKLLFSLLMIIGRLEINTLFIIFTGSFRKM
jgi:trk system potassium uptake protein TrkH